MVTIRQLNTLRTIANQGTFVAAARALNFTQSAVSMQVAGLEDALGVALFDRSQRPPSLTHDGKLVLRYANAIMGQYDEMVGIISQRRGLEGEIKLGVIPTCLTTMLPAALLSLRKNHPKLAINVSSQMSGELVDMLRRNEIDAALLHSPSDVSAEFQWVEVTRQKIVILAPPKSIETDPKELFANLPYIRFSRTAKVAPLIEQRLSDMGIDLQTRAEIGSLEAIHMMVESNVGASILPDVGVRSDLLRVLPFGEPPIYRTIGVLSYREAPISRLVSIVADAFV